jgi:hypothetical protein
MSKKQNYKRVASYLSVAIAVLAFLHILTVLIEYYSGYKLETWQLNLFNLDAERNVPTFYTAALLAGASYLVFKISRKKVKSKNQVIYSLLSLFFLLLAIDEIWVIHERIAEPVRKLLNLGDANVLYHAWIIPVALIATVSGAILFKVVKGKTKDDIFTKKVLKYIALLIFGVVLLEAVGTKLYIAGAAYKLGPVLLEELFEITIISTIVFQFYKRSKSN